MEFLRFATLLEAKRTIAVSKKQTPRKTPDTPATAFFRINAKMTVGMQERYSIFAFLEKGCLIKSSTCFLKTTITEVNVAKCNSRLKNKKSSLIPNSFSNKIKCPLDEIGKNSVSPCTTPKKKDSAILKINYIV